MSYVDAGYVIALLALALYACSLLVRRRRLEQAAGRTGASERETGVAGGATTRPGRR
ncbi:MAG TPA: hypothetical protein VND62_07935 [Acidimicrobiales bacterium]|nr:hypothetical protein [Acidimicrobiales bacterium]